MVWREADKARKLKKEDRKREHFRIPVCVGISGTGKTRLLREYPRIIEQARLTTRKTAAIYVKYFNGHSIRRADRTLDIDVSFAARMVYSACKLGDQSGWSLQEFLERVESTPSMQRQLSIIKVLKAYRVALVGQGFINEEDVLQIVVAVDEYQSLDDDPLKGLVDLLLDACMELDSAKLHIFPVLAGTEWNKIPEFGSSSTVLRKIPTNFLSTASARDVAFEIFPAGKNNQKFLRHVVCLGDIPRQIVEFSKEVNTRSNEIEDWNDGFTDLCQAILRENSEKAWKKMNVPGLLRVLAYSISRLPVVGSNFSPVKPSPNGEFMTWDQLANRGILFLEDERYVQVPLSLVMLFEKIDSHDFKRAEEKTFVRSTQKLLKISDQLEDWQRWERFGAHFFAVKINALRLLGRREVKLETLFPGYDGLSDITVNLFEAMVVQTQHALNKDMDLKHIVEYDDSGTTYSAFDKKRTIIFLNATNGEGVDIFFALKQTNKRNSYMCFLDQRKLRGGNMTMSMIDGLMERAQSVTPSCQKLNLRWNVVIANPISSRGPSTDKKAIPRNCVLLLRDSLSKFLGPAKNLALSFIAVNINDCPQTRLQSLLGCSDKFADIIRSRIQKKRFCKFSELEDFFRENEKELPDNVREFVLL